MLKKALLFIPLFIFSQSTVAASHLDNLFSKLEAINTFQANFSQAVHSSGLAKQTQASGHFALQKPGLFHWEVARPEPQLIVSDGKNLWVYDELLEQVTVQPLSSHSDNIGLLLLSREFSTKNFPYSLINYQVKKDSGIEEYKLKPKDQSSLTTQVTLIFKGGALQGIQLTGVASDSTDIHFSNTKQNEAVAQTLFQFIPPKGVDVVGDSQ